MGVFAIFSTQQPNASNIPTEIRDNLSVRVALGSMSSEGYRMVFGETTGLSPAIEKGSGYIYFDGMGWDSPKPFQNPWLDYRNFSFVGEIERLIKSNSDNF